MIAASFLPEYDHEMAGLRKVLELIPEDKYDWKPHDKSMTVLDLGAHLATIPSWIFPTINDDEIDFHNFKAPAKPTNKAEILARFDADVVAAREVLASASDETMMKIWTARAGDHVVFSMPKVAVYRSMVMNHMIHHRAQLTVYLRMNNIPIPGLYGPSADAN